MNLQNMLKREEARNKANKEEQRLQMRAEIDAIIGGNKAMSITESDHIDRDQEKKAKYEEMQRNLNM